MSTNEKHAAIAVIASAALVVLGMFGLAAFDQWNQSNERIQICKTVPDECEGKL